MTGRYPRLDPTLDGHDQVVWAIEVGDPARLTAAGIGERTRAALSALAAAHGCALRGWVDDDSYDLTEQGTYYRWDIGVPRAVHLDRDSSGVPRAITTLGAWLATQLPAEVSDWTYQPDLAETRHASAAAQLRVEAGELLVALETALLASRRDGAEEIDPLLRCHSNDGESLAGTYALLLARDPDHAGSAVAPWLVLYAGHTAPPGLWGSDAGAQLAQGAFTDHPVLISPRPPGTTWWISVSTATFVPLDDSRRSAFTAAPPSPTPGARHQWTGTDPAALVARAAADLHTLFPPAPDAAGPG